MRVDWRPIMLEFIGDSTTTFRGLAAKHRVPESTLRWRARREMWRSERDRHLRLIADKLSTKTANRALPTLLQLNEQHLRQSEELRYIINSKLKMRTADGKTVMKADVSIMDIARAVMAFGVLYRLDRLALGADTGTLPEPRDRFADMSDEELVEELKRVRARNIIQ